jgi:Na+/proline symporter
METNEIIGIVPWPVAVATAVWFGLMAYKARKNAVLWAIGGGVLGLVVTTLVMGLGQAAFIPFTSAEQSAFRVKIGALAIFIVVCVGWLFTATLHPRLLAPWKRAADTPKEPAPATPATASPVTSKS